MITFDSKNYTRIKSPSIRGETSYGVSKFSLKRNKLNARENLSFKGIKPDKENTKKKKVNVPYITAIISTISQLFGGLCLLVSSILPGNVANIDKQDNAPVIIEQKAEINESGQINTVNLDSVVIENPKRTEDIKSVKTDEEQKAKDLMNTIKDLLSKMGWTSLAIGNITSGAGIAGMGLKSNQPSIVLGGLGVLGCAPLMVIDPTIPLRGALCISLATFFSGFANKIKNDFELKPSEKPREYDLSFLTDKKSWPEGLTNAQKIKELSKKFAGMMKFVAKDQVLLLTSAGKAVDQSVKKLFGIRKELPEFLTIKPSSDQRRISSMLVFAGGIPLVIFGGSIESLTPIANALIGAGFSTGNLGMFAIGKNQKDSSGPALLIGVPMKLIGDFALTSDFGFGLSQMGSASHNYYIAQQNKNLNKETVKDDKNSDQPNSKKKLSAKTKEKRKTTKQTREDLETTNLLTAKKVKNYQQRIKQRKLKSNEKYKF